jgi:hypothetical protein
VLPSFNIQFQWSQVKNLSAKLPPCKTFLNFMLKSTDLKRNLTWGVPCVHLYCFSTCMQFDSLFILHCSLWHFGVFIFCKDDILAKTTFIWLEFLEFYTSQTYYTKSIVHREFWILLIMQLVRKWYYGLCSLISLHKNPTLDPILNEFNQIHDDYYKTHFLIIPPSISR